MAPERAVRLPAFMRPSLPITKRSIWGPDDVRAWVSICGKCVVSDLWAFIGSLSSASPQCLEVCCQKQCQKLQSPHLLSLCWKYNTLILKVNAERCSVLHVLHEMVYISHFWCAPLDHLTLLMYLTLGLKKDFKSSCFNFDIYFIDLMNF